MFRNKTILESKLLFSYPSFIRQLFLQTNRDLDFFPECDFSAMSGPNQILADASYNFSIKRDIWATRIIEF